MFIAGRQARKEKSYQKDREKEMSTVLKILNVPYYFSILKRIR